MCFQDLRSCLIPWTKPQQGKIQRKNCVVRRITAGLQNRLMCIGRQLDHHNLPASRCLWIVTDGSVKNRGIAATLYVLRNESLLLAGFFSVKLRKHQVSWLPCELEALAIGAAIRHFAPYIIQSPHTAEVLTDSRPCVQAYEKLKRG